MNLRESIQNIPDDDWLELREELRGNYRVFLGVCPKRHVKGMVLDFEVVSASDVKHEEDYTVYGFIIKK